MGQVSGFCFTTLRVAEPYLAGLELFTHTCIIQTPDNYQ